MDTFALDLENFYTHELNVARFGSINYLNHPESDIYLLGVAGDEGTRYIGRPENFDWSRIKGARVIAHNYSFDGALFETHPELPRPADYNCTAALAAYCGSGRSLKEAAKKFLGVEVSKAPRDAMKGRSWERCSEAEQETLRAYCLSDAELCLQLWQKCSANWPSWEQRLSRHTLRIGFDGIRIDNRKLKQFIARAEKLRVDVSTKIPWEAPLLSRKKAAQRCQELGIWVPNSFAEDSEQCAAWEQEFGESHTFVADMRNLRKANLLLRKLEAMQRRIMPNGRMNFDLRYFGAHTGRWSGGGGVNLQNLDKMPWEGIYLRSVLVPEEGKIFIICDLSQIEPRILAWLVDDERLLTLLRQGYSVYEAMAVTWGVWQGAAGTLKQSDPFLYAFMKSMTLGCGYGLGAEKFRAKCAEVSIHISLEEASRRVLTYRQRNPLVVRKWHEFDVALQRHLLKRELTIYLPTDRVLHYPELQRRREPDKIVWNPDNGQPRRIRGKEYIRAILPTEKGVRETRLWGGVLVENICQALARDIFAACLLRLEDAGIRIVLHSHDEVVCEVSPEVAPEDIEHLMVVAPSWAPELPLGAEAKRVEHYVK